MGDHVRIGGSKIHGKGKAMVMYEIEDSTKTT